MAHLQNAQYLHKRLKNKIYCVSSKGDRTLERLRYSLVFCGTLGLSQILVLLLTVGEGLIPKGLLISALNGAITSYFVDLFG